MRFAAHGPKSYIKVIEHHLINSVAAYSETPTVTTACKADASLNPISKISSYNQGLSSSVTGYTFPELFAIGWSMANSLASPVQSEDDPRNPVGLADRATGELW